MFSLKHVIISRTDSIGDVVLTLPVAFYLKKLYPEIKIGFLGKSYTKDVITCCPYVDQFIDLEEFLKQPVKVLGNEPDTIIHVFPQKKIAQKAKEYGIKQRIGTTNRWYHWLYCNRLIRLSRKNSDLHESQLNLRLIMETIPDLSEISKIKLLEDFSIDIQKKENKTDKFKLIIHPKSKGSAREWSLQNYSNLIEHLPRDRIEIFISGTDADEVLLSDFLSRHKDRVVNLCGKLTLIEFIKFISTCDALLACSTGPLHLAAALRINAIGIYPPMRPIHPGRWAPIGRKVKVFVENRPCSDCKVNKNCHCLNSITPREVKDYILGLC